MYIEQLMMKMMFLCINYYKSMENKDYKKLYNELLLKHKYHPLLIYPSLLISDYFSFKSR